MPVEIGGLSLLKKLTRHDKGNIYIYKIVFVPIYWEREAAKATMTILNH